MIQYAKILYKYHLLFLFCSAALIGFSPLLQARLGFNKLNPFIVSGILSIIACILLIAASKYSSNKKLLWTGIGVFSLSIVGFFADQSIIFSLSISLLIVFGIIPSHILIPDNSVKKTKKQLADLKLLFGKLEIPLILASEKEILLLNSTAEALFSHSGENLKEQAISKNLLTSIEVINCRMKDNKKDTEFISGFGNVSILSPTGSTMDLLISSTSMSDLSEGTTLYSFIDITKFIAAESSLKRDNDKLSCWLEQRTAELTEVKDNLFQLIDTANAPILEVDEFGDVNQWNQSIARITGVSLDDMMGRNFIETMLNDSDHQGFKLFLDSALRGADVENFECNLKATKKENITILLNATARKDHMDKRVGVFLVGQDITRLIESRKQLEIERLNLERTVYLRTKELQSSLDKFKLFNLKLEEANKHKSTFLSSMSHELRTPLNAVLGFADLLERQFFGKLNEKQFSYVKQINSSGKHLLALINDLLDMTKIDAGAMELVLEEFSLREVIDMVQTMMKTQFLKKKISSKKIVDPEIDIIVADKRKLKQILLNLISNAVKYSEQGGHIEITALKETDSKIKMSVSDKGIGIEPEEVDKIFSEFYQADKIRDAQLGGTGIGLALTKRLVELHGGTIGTTSEINKGSTFWFTIPIREITGKLNVVYEKIEDQEKKPQKRRKILIAEDNDVNLTMLLDMLKIQNHIIQIAKNGKEAVTMLSTFKPDLILMDIRMPVMDGLEATKRIRLMPDFENIPILALTASTGKNAVDEQIAAGCTAHLAKPIQTPELFEALSKYLDLEQNSENQ
ncbi:response regulator [bacterium]|nr:response regulator [bacterium]